MKKVLCLAIAFLLLSITLLSSGCISTEKEDIIRIHIRANSNSEEDQRVKYLVKDAIVDYITPLSEGIESKEDMYALLTRELENLMDIACAVLVKQGYSYGATAELNSEEFPARDYDGVTLPAGIYDALIIRLGTGKGDNWWCVAYPPLCFIGAEDDGTDSFKYKSKLMELLDKD
jgi:stage II sporulation protein R